MIRVVVLYPQSGNNWFNMEYYKKYHIPLVRKCLEPFGMEKIELDSGISGMEGPAPYFAIVYMTFKNIEQFQNGLAEHGKIFTDDMSNYTKEFILQIKEVVEI